MAIWPGTYVISNITYSPCIYRKGLPGLKEARDGTLGRGRQLSRTWNSSRRRQRRKGCGSGSTGMLNRTMTSRPQLQGSLEVVGRLGIRLAVWHAMKVLDNPQMWDSAVSYR